MTEGSQPVQRDHDDSSGAQEEGEAPDAHTTTGVSLESSARNAITRFLWKSLNFVMRWLYRIVMSVLIIIVAVGSITALIAGVIAAWEEWAIWQGLSEQGLDENSVLRTIFSTAGYRTAAIVIASYFAGYLFMQLQFRKTFGLWFRPLKDARQIPVEELAKLQQNVIAGEALRDFAVRYSKAWSSNDAAAVAALFSVTGTLRINAGETVKGRPAITAAVQEFMDLHPEMQMTTSDLVAYRERSAFHDWQLIVENEVDGEVTVTRISGRENWRIGDDRLIASSEGLFNHLEYQRKLGDSNDEQ